MWQRMRGGGVNSTMNVLTLPQKRQAGPKLGPPPAADSRRETLPQARITDWSALETRLIRIGDSSFGRDQDDAQHIRSWLVCREGEANEGRTDPNGVPAADWVIATPGCGENALPDDAKGLLLTFDAAWPNGESLFDEAVSRSFSAEPYLEMEAAALALLCFVRNHLADTGKTPPNPAADFHIYTGLKQRLDAWMVAFIAAMTNEGAVPTRLGISDQRIQRALRLLDSWPLDLPLDRNRLAHEAGITVPHLARLFNAQFQCTPSRYFDSRRIAHACRSLRVAEPTIKAIASELGFHSEAHFSHWFKQHEGACPRSFRQAHVGQA